MTIYLLDTNTASYIIKGVPRVCQRLEQIPIGQVAISVVTEAELRFGLARLPNASRLKVAVEAFLLHVDIFPWDSEAAARYAELRAQLEQQGTPIGNLDTMIAAHALATGAVLVSSDRAFRRIKQLRVEDWTRPF